MKSDERNLKKIKITPFFYFNGNCGKVCPTDSDFFWGYLVPLDVDVTGNITVKLCEIWSEFNIFCTLVTMAIIVKKNRRITIHHPTAVIRNGAKTISLPNVVWET